MPKKATKPVKKQFKILNWKLSLLATVLIVFFTYLGAWQLYRGHQKRILINHFSERTLVNPVPGSELNNVNDWRFYRALITGHFDNEHTILLDNKTFHGKVGYEIYTPFVADGIKSPILVDRGFIELGASRQTLPEIHAIKGKVTLLGMLNLPPLYRTLGKINDLASDKAWPLRVESLNFLMLDELLKIRLFPYTLVMDPKDPRAYPVEWQVSVMGPERHQGYAVQWFALALTLLILFVALNRA